MTLTPKVNILGAIVLVSISQYRQFLSLRQTAALRIEPNTFSVSIVACAINLLGNVYPNEILSSRMKERSNTCCGVLRPEGPFDSNLPQKSLGFSGVQYGFSYVLARPLVIVDVPLS